MGGERGVPRELLLLGLPLFLALAASCGADVTSAAPAVDRLNRMARAEAAYAYEGMKTVTVRSGKREWVRAYYVQWDPARGTRIERMGEASGNGEKGRRSGSRWNRWWSRLYWLKDRELLLRNYRVQERGLETVAGRPGVALEIRPVHPGRPRIRLVVDEETGLLLDYLKFDYRGEPVFHSRFTALRLWKAAPGRAEEPRGPGAPSRGGKERRAGAPFRVLRPGFLPAGFERKGEWIRGKLVRQVLSDGLTWIEIVERRAASGSEGNVVRQCRRGSRVYLRVVLEGVEIRLVGRIDPAELLAILESME